MSEAELHFIRARLRGGISVQGPPRRADHPAARRAGLRRRRPRHPRPRHRRPRRHRAPVRHLRRTGSAPRRVKAFNTAGLTFPVRRHRPGPQGRARLEAAAPPRRAADPAQPPLRRRVHLRAAPRPPAARREDDAHRCRRGRNGSPSSPRRPPRIHHPGPVRRQPRPLAANAAAHGRDRAAGPPREGPALLQGIIICGTCGRRMTVRYHQRRGGRKSPPTCASATASTAPTRSARPSPAPASTSGSGSCSSTPSPRWPSRPPSPSPPSSSTAPPKPTRCAARVQEITRLLGDPRGGWAGR